MRCVVFALIALVSIAAHAYTIDGVVLGPDTRPISGATVWISQDRVVQTTESDDGGRFQFNNLHVGDVVIVARKDEYSFGGVTARIIGSTEVSVHVYEAAEIQLRIIDQRYKPVEGARLTNLMVGDLFHIPVDDFSRHGFPAIRSDAEGKMVIPKVPAGAFVRFTVDDPRYAQTYVPYFSTGHDEQDIVLKDGIVVRGRVTNPDDEGVPKARVSLFTQTRSGPRELAEPLTDPEGFYNARVQPGPLAVAVQHPDFAPAEVQPGIVAPEAEQVTVDVALQPPHFVSGTVVNAEGQPVGGVDVAYLRDEAIYTQTLTDRDGRYRMSVAQGEGFVYVFAPEEFMVEGTAKIPMNIERGREIELQAARLIPLPVIEGTILAIDGEGVENAIVRSTNLQQPVWDITDSAGQYRIEFDSMPYEERIELVAEHPLRFQRRPFTIDPRDPREGAIKLFDYDPDLTVERKGYNWNDLSGLEGEPAPELACGEWWNGGPVRLKEEKGNVVVLTLWGGFATIGPGRHAIHELNQLHEALSIAGDVTFVAVHDNSLEPADVERYINEYGIEYPVGRDEAPAVTFTRYRTTTIPQTVVIGRDGNLRYYDTSGRTLELIKILRRE